MYELKIGIQLTSLRMPFKKALLTAARLGVQGVEIDARNSIKPQDLTDTAIRHLRKMLNDLNLRVTALSFRTRRGYDVIDELDRRIDATKQAMRVAYQLGTSVVINHIGRVPDKSEGPQWDLLTESLSELGRHGQHVGALLAAETGTERGEDLKRLVDALPTGSLGVNLNPGKLIINNFSPREAVDSLGANVFHVHAKDGVRDLAQGRGVEVQLGRGSAEFPELIGALEEHQYRGYFTVERDNCENPFEEVSQAVTYLQNL